MTKIFKREKMTWNRKSGKFVNSSETLAQSLPSVMRAPVLWFKRK